ncbi:MAG: ATPase domain-containing protein [Candidatus Norongarragalinales archaeon]
MDRVPTGVYGLDELIQGGFPKKRVILVSGACGTGKSIFSMQFLYRGAIEYEEPGVFVTFDEMPSKIRQDMSTFGWDLTELEKNNYLAIIDATSARAGTTSEEEHAILPTQLDFDRLLLDIVSCCKQTEAKRLVIDSIPAMAFRLNNQNEIRQAILKLAYVVAKAGITTIMTSEVPEHGEGLPAQISKYEVEEYVADGVILLDFIIGGGDTTRSLYIRKMRGTKHSLEMHPFQITDKGIVVRKVEDVIK